MTPEKVPFHLPNIPKPQDIYDGNWRTAQDNFSQPFIHEFLELTPDEERYVHPLEKFPELEFTDKDVGCIEPVKSLPLEDTPLEIVTNVKELKLLAEKLKLVDEFAVDLEHNDFRSFQGITCLMQVSTRKEDFIVDTLKLRIHVGPHLREIFQDPKKKKVMHGAGNDILWLQRDFGIYVCNLFDTHEALKVLKTSGVLELDNNSLECLLHHFCGVTVSKAYKKSDWRLRPLPKAMINYAREDTHYLLDIHDQMRRELQSASMGANPNGLFEVYRNSSELCKKLYQKKLFTDTSYLRTYGLREAELNSQQLSIVAGLYEWRDWLAREEDESTGYILPNATLIDIARRMPRTVSEVQQCLQLNQFDVDPSIILVLIEASLRNAPACESAVQLSEVRDF